jgi:hypothetical protein
MRERVSVHGGELIAEPRSVGGFGVRARLPVLSARVEDPVEEPTDADRPIGAR